MNCSLICEISDVMALSAALMGASLCGFSVAQIRMFELLSSRDEQLFFMSFGLSLSIVSAALSSLLS